MTDAARIRAAKVRFGSCATGCTPLGLKRRAVSGLPCTSRACRGRGDGGGPEIDWSRSQPLFGQVFTTPNTTVMVGIIGGSGLDDPDIMVDREEVMVDTPYGKPSDALIKGSIGGVPCVLLARHGRKHTVMPSNVNYRGLLPCAHTHTHTPAAQLGGRKLGRAVPYSQLLARPRRCKRPPAHHLRLPPLPNPANLFALKEIGCTHVVVSTACGSLREENKPGDIIVIDQYIDRTTKRAGTFLDGAPGARSCESRPRATWPPRLLCWSLLLVARSRIFSHPIPSAPALSDTPSLALPRQSTRPACCTPKTPSRSTRGPGS